MQLLKVIARLVVFLIVDECRESGCHGESIFINLVQKSKKELNIKLHAAKDSFISLGDAATLTLPSRESIVEKSLGLLNE